MKNSELEFEVVAYPTADEYDWNYYPVIRMRYLAQDFYGNLSTRTIDIWKGKADHQKEYQAIDRGMETLAKSLNMLVAGIDATSILH